MNFCVVPVYNSESIIEKCLASISAQQGEWRCTIVNDASTDRTEEIIRAYLRNDPRFTLFSNRERKGSLYTKIRAILLSGAQENDLVFQVDGDDFLVSEDAFSSISRLADQSGDAIFYGNFLDSDGKLLESRNFPVEVIEARSFRQYDWLCYPLRAFRAGLVHRIDFARYFLHDRKWIDNSADKALMFCLLELAPDRVRHVPEAYYQIGIPPRSDKRAGMVTSFLVRRLPPLPKAEY